MFKKYSLFITALLISFCIQAVQAKQNRIALVIGNSDYKNAPLTNPGNDATDMTKVLKRQGFKVTKLINANQQKMEEAITKFGKKLYQKNTVGLFFFAGHGVQVNNTNYLVPTGANITEANIKYKAVDAGQILSEMSLADNGLNMMILDACRNNPFSRSFRSSTRGLAKMQAPTGSVILYATSPGDVAADGSGRNGLFTEKLMKNINKKGFNVEKVFKQTAIAVSNASGKKQVPYFEGVILGDFYFNGNVTVTQPNIQVASADSDMADKQENTFWNTVISDNSKEMYQAYLKEYSNGHYKVLAEIKLKEFNAKEALKTKVIPVDATLTIRSNLNGDTVTINGEDKGSTRLDLKLKPGIYEIEVSKDGYSTWEQSIKLVAGVNQTVYAKLKENSRSITESITGMELIKVPKGCFDMGSYYGNNDEKPVHKVCITKNFYLGKYEVTQSQWSEIMGYNPSKFPKGSSHPVESVSWNDVQDFIKKLNQRTGKKYRLPSEAEWEYACRSGGKKQKYCGGDDVSSYGWYDEEWENGHHSVGQKSPNGLGLYDMSGNVWEWVQDRKGSYPSRNVTDPSGPSNGNTRVNRGGSWSFDATNLRATYRNGSFTNRNLNLTGFRLARDL
ncbi:MAG: SUMF1/EgtB/PvdO family nonheme iron enzyme [Gammaproteobacteria bacterium]|nr:SUMF1/EgtB/PvdO family nonheme iron enzyme [Gammaproteobacteria bacterium]